MRSTLYIKGEKGKKKGRKKREKTRESMAEKTND